MKSIRLLCILMVCFTQIYAQQTDSVKVKELEEVNILEQRYRNTIERLPLTQGTYLFGGKKSEVINVLGADANIAEKTPRQIFAKVPGVFVYDMDGTGNQTNISTRGLDPHRGWEFNIRADGIITNSDMYAYPASHFSLPMEALQTIQLVRGTGSLQYGAQFGGMLNFISKQPDTTKAFNFETINSVGSFGLVSTYNGISGKIGKLQYYGYFSRRRSDGYRDNSESNYGGEALGLIYQVSSKVTLKADFKHSKYVYHIPGPLTDSMFYANPRMSTRSRNYFNPTIYVPSFSADFRLSARTKASIVASAVLGDRNSVMFDKPSNVVDAIDPKTLQYANRQIDMDHFNSYSVEARLLHNYTLGKVASILVTGVQLMNNDLNRQQLGKGTTGTDFDLSMTGDWVRDMHLKTKNFAFFAENRFAITSKFSVTPGIRVEVGESNLSGKIAYYDANQLPTTISHKFPLLGLNANYQLTQSQNIYAGFAQAYRPVVFKDIIPSATYEKIDKNLKDAYGFNAEMGYRGNTEHWKWDISAFMVQYNNRMGMTYGTETDGSFYYLRTNIGNSRTTGLEMFIEYDTRLSQKSTLSIFTSTAYMDGRYQDASIRVGDKNVSVKGNKIETTPEWINRNGLTFRYTKLSVTALYSYTAKSYADALNTVKPSATGSVGLVPSYALLDINATYRLTKSMMVKLNINNLTNEQYFTKRPAFYPGPAVWSSDGRSVNLTFGLKI